MRTLNRNLKAILLPLTILFVAILGCDAWTVINGKIVDETGKPIAGAKITVKQGDSEVGNHVTDESGKINIYDNICPMPGCSTDISVTVSKNGFATESRHFDASKRGTFPKNDLVITLTAE